MITAFGIFLFLCFLRFFGLKENAFNPEIPNYQKTKKHPVTLLAGKESACNAGNSSLIPRSGQFTGEGIGYPLQYCWASLVAQLVKNSDCNAGVLVRSLGWEYPLEKGKATHSTILTWRIPWAIHGVAKSWT